MKKAHSPITKYKLVGKKAPPKAPLLYDIFGFPLETADELLTDIHGKEVQPEKSEYISYRPQEAPDPENWKANKLEHEKKLARQLGTPFSQKQVDEVRRRVLLNLARTIVLQRRRNVGMYHLWFPNAGDIDCYGLREGNPPAATDRPKHLRRLRLEIDVTTIPESIKELVRPGGKLEQMVEDKMSESDDPDIPSGMVLQETLARVAASMTWQGGGEL